MQFSDTTPYYLTFTANYEAMKRKEPSTPSIQTSTDQLNGHIQPHTDFFNAMSDTIQPSKVMKISQSDDHSTAGDNAAGGDDDSDNPMPDGNTEKQNKYDRQLRLWGDHGQQCLENANVCLLNVTAVGTEILKCLILPGVGRFSIVDDSITTETDLGSNFFLDKDSLGKLRAERACALLQELNNDTKGGFIIQKPVYLLENDPEYFKQFTLVIASRMSDAEIYKLGNYLWQANIPLMVCDSIGYLGYIRIALKEITVIESHPDNTLEDLRLDQPFPNLASYIVDIDMDSMEKLEHSHTPYLVIIYKYLQQWRKQNNMSWPKTYKEKCQIKDLIRSGIRVAESGVQEDEENFEEALRNVNKALSVSKIPSQVQALIDDPACSQVAHIPQNNQFWIMIRALKEFVSTSDNGLLPLRGSLPDMFSDSRRYIELQNIYKEKADSDIAAFNVHLEEIMKDLQLPNTHISPEDAKLFCKNCHFLNVIRGKSIHDEHKSQNMTDSLFGECVDVYLAVRSVHKFVSQHNRYPGQEAAQTSADVANLKEIAEQLWKDLGMESEEDKPNWSLFEEICRCCCLEIHAVSAVLGGMAAQEAIKVLTRQFVTVDNTFLYNGITQTTCTLKL